MKCDLHPGVSWNGGAGVAMVEGRLVPADSVPCFVCHPTQEAEGATQHLTTLVPDPTEYIRPGVNQCVILTDPTNDGATCKRPGSGRTILGFCICDSCFDAVRAP